MANKSLATAPADQTILVTGGAGFIGSHTCVELLEQGYNVVVVDDLSNSSEEAIRRIGEITGKPEKLTFYQVDILDREAARPRYSLRTTSMRSFTSRALKRWANLPRSRSNTTGTTLPVRSYCSM